MTEEQDDLIFEFQELQTEIEVNVRTVNNCCNILKKNTEKLRKLKEMNHRTPYKPQVEYYDEQMVIVNGVSYTRTKPTPIVIQEDENTIVVGGVKYQKVEEPKPPTLYDVIYEWRYNRPDPTCEILLDMIVDWLPNTRFENGDGYNIGWNDCLQKIEENLK